MLTIQDQATAVEKMTDNAHQIIWNAEFTTENTPANFCERINDLLFSDFANYAGRQNISATRAKYLESWGASNWENEQQKLLLILGRILLKDSHSSCACLRYCKLNNEIQIAFPSSCSPDFDQEGLKAIKNFVVLHQEGKDVKTYRRELTAMAIVKDSASVRARSASEIKSALSGRSENEERNVEIFNKLKTSFEKFGDCWEKGQLSSIHKTRTADAVKTKVDRAMEDFLFNYSRYYELIKEIAREQLEDEEQPILATLLLPLVHVHDTKCLIAAVESDAYSALAAAIKKDDGIKKILNVKKQHAEMKMLEKNNFKISTFTGEEWPAVITRPPCLCCWMTLWAVATNDDERIIIGKRLGFSGFFYLKWGVPTFPVEQGRDKRIICNYLELAKMISKMIFSDLSPRRNRNLDSGQVVLDLTNSTSNSTFANRLPVKDQSPVELILLQQDLQR